MLPLRHAARTAAAASRLSRAATDQVAARTAEQLFATLGELKGGAAKLGQAMSVFEAAMPEEVAAPYRSALRRLTDAAPAMPAEVARRVVAADLAVAYGPGWQQRLVAFDDTPAAAASIGQVHRGQWRDDGGRIVDVAVKVQYPGVGKALRSDLRQARLLARVMARLTRLNVSGLADELASRIVEELDYVREGRVQTEVAAAFTRRVPEALAAARAAGVREPPGRTSVTVPAVYAATPRVLITGWLEGASLSTLLDGRTDLLPAGWRELDSSDAADLAARLLGHAIYAPAACTGWMHADLHAGNFLLLPGGRLGMLDFGAVAATPGGIPAPFGQLAAAVLAGDGPAAMRLARQVGALAPDAEVDPQLIVELLHPIAATAAADSFTYSRPWLRRLMAHLTAPRFAPALRKLTPPPRIRPRLAGDALGRRTLRAARRDGAHPRVPPGLLPRVPRRHPPRPGRGRRARRSATPAKRRPPTNSDTSRWLGPVGRDHGQRPPSARMPRLRRPQRRQRARPPLSHTDARPTASFSPGGPDRLGVSGRAPAAGHGG